MKISNNDQISLKSKTEVRRNSDNFKGKTQIGRESVPPPGKFPTATQHLEKLLSSLSSPRLMKLKSLQKVLPPLHEVLRLWRGVTPNPLDGDSLLFEKFIGSWLKKYGNHLPQQQKKDLSGLSNFLRSKRLELLEDESSKLLYSISSGLDKENPLWKIRFQNRKKSDSEEREEQISCIFDLKTDQLGEIRTVLTMDENRKDCLFRSSRKDTAKFLSDSLPEFRKQLLERGVKLNQIRVSRKRETLSERETNSTKGLDLWG